MMQGTPFISLCMIVKNEEQYLEGCLASASPFVDEIVIVDTGSTDRTIEIARAFGARVFTFEWINDFAAARNESLGHATGEWVLQLDADERLDLLGTPSVLKELAGVPGIDAYAVLIKSYREEAGRTVYGINHNLRFFRRLPGIRYERQVHESVEPFLARNGSNTANASFIIEHLGYHVDPLMLNRKLERNLEILEQYASSEPDNAFALYYLGGTYRAMGRRDEALAIFRRVLGRSDMTHCLRAMTLNAMNLIHLGEKDYASTIETAEQSLRVLPHQNTARFFMGAAHYNQGNFEEALPYLYFCYQYWRRPPIKQTTELSQEYTMSEPDLLKALALCFAHKKSYINTIAFSRRFLELQTEDSQVYHILGLALINVGRFSEGIDYLQQSIQLGVDPESLYFPMAYGYLKTGNIQEAIHHFSQVRDLTQESIDQSFGLFGLLVSDSSGAPELESLVDSKRALLLRGSFQQLGSLVSALCRWNRLDALKALFRTIHARSSELESLWAGVVEYYEAQGRIGELGPVAESLARAFPTHPVFWNTLGIICIKMGKYFRAVEVYTAITRLMPDNETARRTLAGLLVTVGKEAQALQILSAAVCVSPA